jgi:RNA polymerase sigma-70 factor (ECF subfamily)
MTREAPVEATSFARIEAVYRAEGERLYRALLLFSGNKEIAQDALAEAFAQALARGDALRTPERWVWKVAYRVASAELQRMRSASNQVSELADEAYEIEHAPLLLSLALKQLSPMQRAAVSLHDYAGYSLRETAEIACSTASAVSVHLVRAHKKLRRSMEEEDV